MFKSLSRSQDGNLEAEREHEAQHDQEEDTYHPQGEQCNYRCDRVFYVT
jgi:hypothetical protein